MLCALAYCDGDWEQAQRLIDWINELGGFGKHKLLLAREQAAPQLTGVGNAETITFNDVYHQWPISTTLAFSTVARHVEYTTQEPFLWIEPDIVPLRSGWLDKLADEYKQTKRPFMGALVPEFKGTPAHMSGIGIWPGIMTEHAGPALMLDEQAPFDLMAIDHIYPKCFFTDKIVHRWDRPAKPPVKSMADIYSVVTTECVLFHGNKDGSWIDVLRQERGGPSVSSHVRPSGGSVSYNPISEPKEGTESNGMIWKNGSWHEKTLAAGNSQIGVKQKASSVSNDHGAGSTERLPDTQDFYPSFDGTVGIGKGWIEVPRNMEEVKRHAEALGEYAKDNGFARMRVMRELKAVGLQPKGKKK